MSQIKGDSIIPVSGVASGQGGGIVQVVSAFKGDRFTTSSTSFVDISGMSITITPKSVNNKILLMGSFGAASTKQSTLDHGQAIRVLRNGSADNKLNALALAAGNRQRLCWKGVGNQFNNDHNPGGQGFSGVDDPSSTSALTYKVQVACQSSSYQFILNGNNDNTDGTQIYNARFMSSLIAMEISG